MDYRVKKNNEKKSLVKKVVSSKKNANVVNTINTTNTATTSTTTKSITNTNANSEVKKTIPRKTEDKETKGLKLNSTKETTAAKCAKSKEDDKVKIAEKLKKEVKTSKGEKTKKDEKLKKNEKGKIEEKTKKEEKENKNEKTKKVVKNKVLIKKKNVSDKNFANDVKKLKEHHINVDPNRTVICESEQVVQENVKSEDFQKTKVGSENEEELTQSHKTGYQGEGLIQEKTMKVLTEKTLEKSLMEPIKEEKEEDAQGEVEEEEEDVGEAEEEEEEEVEEAEEEEEEEVGEAEEEEEEEVEEAAEGGEQEQEKEEAEEEGEQEEEEDQEQEEEQEQEQEKEQDKEGAKKRIETTKKQPINKTTEKELEEETKDIEKQLAEKEEEKDLKIKVQREAEVNIKKESEGKVNKQFEVKIKSDEKNTTVTTETDEVEQEHKFERKVRKSEQLKKQRQNEMIIAYWLKGIVNILNDEFQNGDIRESRLVGRKTAEVLKKVVEISYWKNVYDLIGIVKYLGKEIIKNNKLLFVIPNVVRRVLKIIRTEHFRQLYMYNNNYTELSTVRNNSNNIIQTADANTDLNVTSKNQSVIDVPLYERKSNTWENNNLIFEKKMKTFDRSINFYFEDFSNESTYKIPATNTLKHSIIEGITELMAEIDVSWEEGEQRASYDLFMENDVILTLGHSVGVEKFLKNINKKKDGISVIVVGGDINRSGFRMAQLLSEDGVDTTYISDSAVFAVIPKVTKIVLGSVAVSSSGGAITKLGGYNIATSAQFNSKPVTIILPLFKLLYVPLFDPIRQNELQPGPPKIYRDTYNMFVKNPKYDYIPEHLITLYITEMGPVDSFQLYNIAQKKYHWEDLDLSFD